MKIETKRSIGDIVHLFGYDDWPCVITAITVRASGQVEYQLEWHMDGDTKCEWFEDVRIDLLERAGKASRL